ncbi:hypothetical protein DPSP01_004918 [Paraphaeosphaeria sporulosa]
MTSSQSRIAELAAAVAQNTQLIDQYLSEKGLPHPSFDATGPADFNLPPELEQARVAVLQATQELNDLLQGPRNLVENHQHNLLVPLKLIAHFDIAQKVPLDGETTFKALAEATNIEQGALTRILRLGIANRIFREPRHGVIAHSAASREIAEDEGLAGWVRASVEEMWPAAEKTVDALKKWPRADEPNQTGFALANQSDKPFYAVLAQDPQRAKRFGQAMSFYTTGVGFSLRHLTDGYPWDTVPGTVIDLGGSHGDAAFALARKYPDLRLIVQELPGVVDNAKPVEGLNVNFIAHDFFQPQPVKGADVYFFRWILHNWPDQYCIQILRALIPALKTGAKILVMDFVMPPPGSLPNDLDRKLRAFDLTMLEIGNAKERDLNEWKALFAEADARFVFKGVKQPPGSRLTIIETSWEE